MGELIELGRHKLWCGDAKDAPFPKVDLVLADPPFQMGAKEISEIILRFGDRFIVAGHGKNYHQLCVSSGLRYHFEVVSIRSKPQSTSQRKSPQILHWNNAFLTTGCDHCFDMDLVDGGYFPSVIHHKGVQSGNYAKPLDWAIALLSICHSQLICDPFGGTGTVLIVCEKLGKTCYISEQNMDLCNLIIKRFNN